MGPPADAGGTDLITAKLFLEVIEDCFVPKALADFRDGNEENIDIAHLFVGQSVDSLRELRIRRAFKEERKPFHSALLVRAGGVAFNFR
jgi:hypothetical protein